MPKTIDARGLSCPQPVMITLAEIRAGETDEIIVMVDNDTAKENVSRAATSKGWTIDGISEEDGVYNVSIKKG